MKKLVLFLAFGLICGVAQAATVHLKNGSAVSGKLVIRTIDYVKVDVSGVVLTYFNDEVDRIEEGEAQVPVKGADGAGVVKTTASNGAGENGKNVASGLGAASGSSATHAATGQSSAGSAEDSYAGMSKKDLINKFLEVFGTKRMMAANFEQMVKSMPPDQGAVIANNIKVEEIIQELLPIYDKYFSEAELKTLIDFYSTPVGKGLVEKLPLLMNESVGVSARYFEKHVGGLADGLKKTGLGRKSVGK